MSNAPPRHRLSPRLPLASRAGEPVAPAPPLRLDADVRPEAWPLEPSRPVSTAADMDRDEFTDAPPEGAIPSLTAPRPTRGFWLAGAIGFACGAVFWHAVGFWSVVHDAVFSGPRFDQTPVYRAPVAGSGIASTAVEPAPAAFEFPVVPPVREALRDLPPGASAITTGSIGRGPPKAGFDAGFGEWTGSQNGFAANPAEEADPSEPAAAPDTGAAWQPAITAAE